MNAKTVDQELRKLCPLFFKLMDEHTEQYVIVGGALRSIREHRPIRDIDIICDDTEYLIPFLKDAFSNIKITENNYKGYKVYLRDYNLYVDMWTPGTHILPFENIDDDIKYRLGWNFNSSYYNPKTKVLDMSQYIKAKTEGVITYNDSETAQRHIIMGISDLIAFVSWKANSVIRIRIPSSFLEGKLKQLVDDTSLDDIIVEYKRHYGRIPPESFILEYYRLKYETK